ncbi:DUF2029 domain-containing protein [Trichocoleus sp. DQ-U1]
MYFSLILVNLLNYWRRLNPLNRNLLLFTFANVVVVNFILITLFSTEWKDLGLSRTEIFLRYGRTINDSWEPMLEAFNYIQSEHQQLLYSKVFFEEQTKFQYPPTSLLVFYFLKINVVEGFLRNIGLSIFNTLKFISWNFIILTISFVIQIFNLSLKKHKWKENGAIPRFERIAINFFLVCLSLSFYPVVKAYTLGQIQCWLNALFAVLFWCWMTDRKKIAGILGGIMCLIKPQYALILIWGILRKQWSFTLGFIATSSLGLIVSISLIGFADHVNYLSVLSFISKHGETFFTNQSINGVLNRWLFNDPILNFNHNSFPPYNPWVYLGTVLSSIALISAALFLPMLTSEKGSITDFSIIALTSTIASPIAWEHHYGILLPIYAFLLPYLLTKKVLGKFTIYFLAISYFLTSNYFAIAKDLAYKKIAFLPLNIFLSYLLAGGLMVLVCLYILRGTKYEINEGNDNPQNNVAIE